MYVHLTGGIHYHFDTYEDKITYYLYHNGLTHCVKVFECPLS
jgi:hypothetical protein